MNQPHPNLRLRDFIGGLFLVAALHMVFGIIWSGIAYGLGLTVPFFSQNYNSILLSLPLFFPGISQIIYLIPAYVYFAKKQRHEVTKGILCGGIVTALLNGSCFGSLVSGSPILFLITAVVTLLGVLYVGQQIANRERR
jgi:hypothetical protein